MRDSKDMCHGNLQPTYIAHVSTAVFFSSLTSSYLLRFNIRQKGRRRIHLSKLASHAIKENRKKEEKTYVRVQLASSELSLQSLSPSEINIHTAWGWKLTKIFFSIFTANPLLGDTKAIHAFELILRTVCLGSAVRLITEVIAVIIAVYYYVKE